jgi:hypothetical protein
VHYEGIRCEIGTSIVIYLSPKIGGLRETSNNLIQVLHAEASKQASKHNYEHGSQLTPCPGKTDRSIGASMHPYFKAHVYWGAQQPFLVQHPIQYIVYQPPTGGAFESVSLPQCMDRPVQYQGPAARLFVRDPYPDRPIKYSNAPHQISDVLLGL